MSLFGLIRLGVACLCLSSLLCRAQVSAVELERVPDGGIQPQTAVDQAGTVHLVSFKGDPAGGDLFYSHSTDGHTFSQPIRVNSVAGSAVAIGNIRGARIAVGRRGNVYVVWNGSTRTSGSEPGRIPMFFTRLNRAGIAFEQERDLIHSSYGIDGGGGIAADRQGRVYVFWHAPLPEKRGEEYRRVWVTRSLDDGATFEPEHVAWEQQVGACGCCSLDAFAAENGRVYVLFRSAKETVHRDMYLLESRDHAVSFNGVDVSPWNVPACVMSSESFAQSSHGIFGAWETDKQVRFGQIDGGRATVGVVAQDSDNQKYPSLAIGRSGTVLVAWAEGMGWKRGGSLHWQLFDSSGKHSLGSPGSAAGVPVWSVVSAFARRDGRFEILY